MFSKRNILLFFFYFYFLSFSTSCSTLHGVYVILKNTTRVVRNVWSPRVPDRFSGNGYNGASTVPRRRPGFRYDKHACMRRRQCYYYNTSRKQRARACAVRVTVSARSGSGEDSVFSLFYSRGANTKSQSRRAEKETEFS